MSPLQFLYWEVSKFTKGIWRISGLNMGFFTGFRRTGDRDIIELEFLRSSEPGGSKFSQDTRRFKLEPAASRQA